MPLNIKGTSKIDLDKIGVFASIPIVACQDLFCDLNKMVLYAPCQIRYESGRHIIEKIGLVKTGVFASIPCVA